VVAIASLLPVVSQAEIAGVSVETLLQWYEFVGALLGLFIAYVAYRGYRRNDSRPMLFIAIGFFTILGVPTGMFLLTFAGIRPPAHVGHFVVQSLEILGLLAIVYALTMDA
jgi:uncharacterized membrane protein (DUF441 family)